MATVTNNRDDDLRLRWSIVLSPALLVLCFNRMTWAYTAFPLCQSHHPSDTLRPDQAPLMSVWTFFEDILYTAIRQGFTVSDNDLPVIVHDVWTRAPTGSGC